MLPDVHDGLFVDIGAHDGVTYSNTLYLESIGWTGLAVEPIPEIFESLRTNRKCITVHGCVAGRSGVHRFRRLTGYSEMLSGLVGTYDHRHLQRIENELRLRGGNSQEIEVNCFTLDDLLSRHGIYHVDYMNIDVEGAEFSILENFPFGNFEISVMGIENAYADYRIPRLLKKKGFEFHSVLGDEFYVSSNT
jgi:FkbM family methyltransferase